MPELNVAHGSMTSSHEGPSGAAPANPTNANDNDHDTYSVRASFAGVAGSYADIWETFLDGPYLIESVEVDEPPVTYGFQNPTAAIIQTSHNGSSWTTAATTYSASTYAYGMGTRVRHVYTLNTPVERRYIRVRHEFTLGGIGFVTHNAMSELRINGDPVDPGDITEPPPFEDPEPGRAIVEIYVTDPDGYRWDEANWDEASWSEDEWVSISEWVIFADVTWGTDRPDAGILSNQVAGQWVIETWDPDRVLDPANVESPFYPLLVPDLPIRLNHATRGVVRTGQVTDISYSHATKGGRISASDMLSRLARALVPPGTTLGDTFSTRVQDAIDAASIRTWIAYATTDMWDAALAPDDPDERKSVWTRISEAAQELRAIAWIDRYTAVRATKWNADHDRGLVIDSSAMVDLQPWVSHDGLYSVIRALDEDGVTIAEAARFPLPPYGERVYERREPTVNSEDWVTQVLADRYGAVLRWRPGTIEPQTAADVDALVRVDLMDIVTLSFPEATPPVESRARVLGMRVRVTDRTKSLPNVLTRWQFTLLTTVVPDEPLIEDDGTPLRYLVSDDGSGEYLYPG
jgi:hypothetical protein